MRTDSKEIVDPTFVRELARFCRIRCVSQDDCDRPVVVTPFGGCYLDLAGFVLALNGTPPRFVIVYEDYDSFPAVNIRWMGNRKFSLSCYSGYGRELDRFLCVQDFLCKEGFIENSSR